MKGDDTIMCKYCEEWWDITDLHLWLNKALKVDGHILFDSQVSVWRGSKNEPKLTLEIVFGDGDVPTSLMNTVPIQYCPFCGEKLTLPDGAEEILKEIES